MRYKEETEYCIQEFVKGYFDYMKIIYENQDFSLWMQEKNGNIIYDCYLILESCSDEQSRDNAYTALYNALTIQFFLCDKLDVCKTLLRYFMANDYTEYKKWHKLIFESDRNKKYEFSDVGVIDKEILSLITEDGWEKSRIPEMVNHCKSGRDFRP